MVKVQSHRPSGLWRWLSSLLALLAASFTTVAEANGPLMGAKFIEAATEAQVNECTGGATFIQTGDSSSMAVAGQRERRQRRSSSKMKNADPAALERMIKKLGDIVKKVEGMEKNVDKMKNKPAPPAPPPPPPPPTGKRCILYFGHSG
eukprot:gnl/TRDRNA2_/TRDRNA2_155968_c1_seq1.p1 gnl/TRDRNA2_/TRDRNA2_155968_c1~~gnl/TRDRNA2_/TRDRNA2_155968_c1_seq1.p1  ORF type:complete len:148 (+),score=34.45 gnl/TRDRNA2_/TRDRNA2_155968_c1_seq1:114-557(+)